MCKVFCCFLYIYMYYYFYTYFCLAVHMVWCILVCDICMSIFWREFVMQQCCFFSFFLGSNQVSFNYALLSACCLTVIIQDLYSLIALSSVLIPYFPLSVGFFAVSVLYTCWWSQNPSWLCRLTTAAFWKIRHDFEMAQGPVGGWWCGFSYWPCNTAQHSIAMEAI